MKKGNKYGTHRVISPKGVLPQPADKLDNNMDEIYDNEILIDVQTLNIDSASFTQIDFIRKRKAQTVSLDVDDINPEDRGYINSIPADVRTPDEEAIRQQRADFMREKVALLKGRYRRLIELRYFDEFSYEEIADTLAIPLGTVKAQLFRARELLLNILQHTEIAKEHGKN